MTRKKKRKKEEGRKDKSMPMGKEYMTKKKKKS